MRRFFIDPKDLKESVRLQGDEFHHLKNVCRLEEGERVELLDGQGRIALAQIQKMEKKSATLLVQEIKQLPPPPRPHVKIVLCLPRFQKMDLIIQKCVELGASEIIPVVSERSFVKTLSGELKGKAKRWRKIATEACKQSGRAWPLQLSDVARLSEIRERTPAPAGLFLYEGESAQDIKGALEKWAQAPENVTLFIGAEGGFSPIEVEDFVKQDFRPVTLGPLVLRVETACIAILSIIQYHFGHMR